ncbi:MAG: CBS domain-containing protein [Flavobacteriales bacterium]|nr:CBS domain-containing protein [Flavobacteriales bacterium]MBL0045136.1 CBS domain-containing protein [Flavobacteriales bacterium]
MHALDLITDDIPPLKASDPVGRALDWMEEFKVSHLPVVEGESLIGLVKDDDLVDGNNARATVGELMERTEVPFVRDRQHIYDVMKLFVERGLTVVPVLDMTGKYLGAINEHEALKRLSEVANVREPGSVLVLEMNSIDYSLTEIARIVEGNDAKVLSVYCHALTDSTRMEVTLKINREDVSDILQTFERYEYQVKTTYQGSRFHEDLRGRYDELIRFINL